MPDASKLLLLTEVAQYTRAPLSTVRHWVASGLLTRRGEDVWELPLGDDSAVSTIGHVRHAPSVSRARSRPGPAEPACPVSFLRVSEQRTRASTCPGLALQPDHPAIERRLQYLVELSR